MRNRVLQDRVASLKRKASWTRAVGGVVQKSFKALLLVIFIIRLMTQEDKDKLKKIQKDLDQNAFGSERNEAENWEYIKSFYLPKTHLKLEEILRDRYNGDVTKFAEDWLIISDQVNEE